MPENPITREEIDTKLALSEARADTKFERALGEMRTAHERVMGAIGAVNERLSNLATHSEVDRATSSLRWTIVGTGIGAVISAVTLMVAVLAWGGDRFSTGLEVHGVAEKAAEKAAQEATAAIIRELQRQQSPPRLPEPPRQP